MRTEGAVLDVPARGSDMQTYLARPWAPGRACTCCRTLLAAASDAGWVGTRENPKRFQQERGFLLDTSKGRVEMSLPGEWLEKSDGL